jgi:zinc protease
MTLPLALAVLLSAAAAPKPFLPGPSVEGVSEYSLPGGLKVLLLPDPAASTVTVNLTVLVGSRHEGYGEKGMAHLLEHLLFKGSKLYADPKKELDAHGGNWNGTTSEDRTNYFETMPASDKNLEFGIRFEADRLVNSFVAKKDLDTEMTVVRNEFEVSETNPGRVLHQGVRALAFRWHNYGRAVIGNRADIEQVPIESLQAFYKKYYQPDNAVLIVSGKFDEGRAFRLIAEAFGRIPKPKRVLTETFTSEPAQDGERSLVVRRVGGAPQLYATWHIPGVTDPDYPAIMVLQGVLGDIPQGRLHQALVDTKKAAMANCAQDEFKEAGLFACTVIFKEGDQTAGPREVLLSTIETPVKLSDAEVARSRDGWLSQYEQEFASSRALGFLLSEWSARGDFRLAYLLRDRLKAVTTADVERVWAKYLKAQNRSIGEYVPTAQPDRATVAPPPTASAALEGYKGGEAVQQGEAFEPSVQNIEKRTLRTTLSNGAKVALLDKKTRAQTVNVVVNLKLGSDEALRGQQFVAQLAASMLSRGTQRLPYKEFENELQRLKSSLMAGGRGQTVSVMVSTKRPQLDELLGLLAEVLKTPAFDAGELEALRAQQLAAIDNQKTEPQALGRMELIRAVGQLPPDHVSAVLPFPEQIAGVKAVTVEQLKAFHARFYGAQDASIAVVGDFDRAAVQQRLEQLLGGFSAKEKYVRIALPYAATTPDNKTIKTPDKANAWTGTGVMIPMNDGSPDYPALWLATSTLGGGASGRLFRILRDQQGLTYGAYASLSVDARNERAALTTTVIHAPQNGPKVEESLQKELGRFSQLTQAELEHARSELLQQRYQGRANDGSLAGDLSQLALEGRTLEWEGKLDEALKTVTAEQANAAVQKYFDPAKVVLVKAGDFKLLAAPK